MQTEGTKKGGGGTAVCTRFTNAPPANKSHADLLAGGRSHAPPAHNSSSSYTPYHIALHNKNWTLNNRRPDKLSVGGGVARVEILSLPGGGLATAPTPPSMRYSPSRLQQRVVSEKPTQQKKRLCLAVLQFLPRKPHLRWHQHQQRRWTQQPRRRGVASSKYAPSVAPSPWRSVRFCVGAGKEMVVGGEAGGY